MSVNLFARCGDVTKSVQLPNPTPKTDANLFSCRGAVESDTLSFLMQKLLVRVLSLKLFIYTSICMLFLRVPFDVRWLLPLFARALVHTFSKYAKFVWKIRSKNASRPFRVCDSSARRARVPRTPGHVSQPFHLLNLNCKFSCLWNADTHTHTPTYTHTADLNL